MLGYRSIDERCTVQLTRFRNVWPILSEAIIRWSCLMFDYAFVICKRSPCLKPKHHEECHSTSHNIDVNSRDYSFHRTKKPKKHLNHIRFMFSEGESIGPDSFGGHGREYGMVYSLATDLEFYIRYYSNNEIVNQTYAATCNINEKLVWCSGFKIWTARRSSFGEIANLFKKS